MATFRRWRRDRKWRRSHSPKSSFDISDIKDNYNWKVNRFQQSNWSDVEAKEAHASVVQYLWRKEHELNNKMDDLKKHIVNKNSYQNCGIEETNQQVAVKKAAKREIEAPLRGVHFRTIEDQTFDKLKITKSERNIENNESYIKKIRAKVNPDIEDDLSEDFKNIIRGKSAYHISAALLSDSWRSAKEARLRELEKIRSKQRTRGIYDIMEDRNNLRTSQDGNREPRHERKWHAEHDYRWNNSDYLNLVGYRMQNNRPCGFNMQNRGDIIW